MRTPFRRKKKSSPRHGNGLVQDTPRREVRVKGKDLLHAAAGATGMNQILACLEEQNLIVIGHIFRYPEKPPVSKNFPYENLAERLPCNKCK